MCVCEALPQRCYSTQTLSTQNRLSCCTFVNILSRSGGIRKNPQNYPWCSPINAFPPNLHTTSKEKSHHPRKHSISSFHICSSPIPSSFYLFRLLYLLREIPTPRNIKSKKISQALNQILRHPSRCKDRMKPL